MGWNYVAQWAIVLPLELVVAGLTVNYWQAGVNVAVWITVFLAAVVSDDRENTSMRCFRAYNFPVGKYAARLAGSKTCPTLRNLKATHANPKLLRSSSTSSVSLATLKKSSGSRYSNLPP